MRPQAVPAPVVQAAWALFGLAVLGVFSVTTAVAEWHWWQADSTKALAAFLDQTERIDGPVVELAHGVTAAVVAGVVAMALPILARPLLAGRSWARRCRP